jgi:hypothetical protein
MTINAVQELEALGYVFQVTESGLHFSCSKKSADSEKVRPLLDRIRANRQKAIDFLKRRQPDEIVQLDQLHEWLTVRKLKITGRSWLDIQGVLTVHVEDAK